MEIKLLLSFFSFAPQGKSFHRLFFEHIFRGTCIGHLLIVDSDSVIGDKAKHQGLSTSCVNTTATHCCSVQYFLASGNLKHEGQLGDTFVSQTLHQDRYVCNTQIHIRNKYVAWLRYLLQPHHNTITALI